MKNNKFIHKEEYQDGKYNIVSLSNGKKELRRILCKSEDICIIPFDTNQDGKIRNLYLAKYLDYLNNDHGYTCMSTEYAGNKESDFDEICEYLNEELGISPDVDNLYYLGSIKHQLPFSKSYKCYGLDLTGFSKDPNGFSIEISDSEKENKLYTVEKIKFNRVVKGDISDSLCLSAAMLLISYLN